MCILVLKLSSYHELWPRLVLGWVTVQWKVTMQGEKTEQSLYPK